MTHKGATIIWDRRNSILPDGEFDQSGMNSLNHCPYGTIGEMEALSGDSASVLRELLKRLKQQIIINTLLEQENT